MATEASDIRTDSQANGTAGGAGDGSSAKRNAVSMERTGCCIVGGGPAGAVLGLMLAQNGVDVTLLEAHHDLDRDFRGDGLMPSTLEIMQQLGLSGRLLQLPHAKMGELRVETRAGSVPLLDLSHLKTAFPYAMWLPQVRFLELITSEAAQYPNFRLVMGAAVRRLIEEDGETRGVCYESDDGWHEVRAALTVAADGRFSKVRQLAGLGVMRNDEPRDVLWLRLPRGPETDAGRPGLYAGRGGLIVVLPRPNDWQIGYTLPKGHYKQLRSEGLPALQQAIVELVPWLAGSVCHLQDWKQTSLLSIESGRVRRWYRPGLLLIGDAAHVMSPVAAVGINCAIQDAVVAANVLSEPLKAQHVTVHDLATVQRKRERPIRVVQAIQRRIQRRVLDGPEHASLISRLLLGIPWVRRFAVQILALGVPRVRVAGPIPLALRDAGGAQEPTLLGRPSSRST